MLVLKIIKYIVVGFLSILGCIIVGIVIFNAFQTPSNDKHWYEKESVIATTVFDNNAVTIKNMRNYTWRSETDYDTAYYDKEFLIEDVQTVDFFLSTFARKERIGHIFLSFGLKDGSQITISIEARKEQGEEYDPLLGLVSKYEIYYVVADEKDVVSLRTEIWDDPVYFYPLNIEPKLAQALLRSMLEKTNKLSVQPEFYNTLVDSCSSALRKHANSIKSGSLGLNLGMVLPGYSDYYLYKKGFLNTDVTKQELRIKHRINEKVGAIIDSEDFSRKLRE